MTTLALNYSTKVFNFTLKPLWTLLKSFGYAMACSRAMQANQEIARHLLPEYPDHTYYSLLHELNVRTLDSLKKEFYGD